MSKKVYVLTLEGEPIHVYTKEDSLFEQCKQWFNTNRTSFDVEWDFSHWAEDRGYENTDEDYEKAWDDFVEWSFNDGTWGDYTWFESILD